MNNQFTHGPWTVTADGLNVKTATTDIMICENGGETSAIEDKANARLIAAAPDLFKALKPFANFACSPPGECKCFNCKARDAINKAVVEQI